MEQQDIKDVEEISRVFSLSETIKNVKIIGITITEKEIEIIWNKINPKKPKKKVSKSTNAAKTQKDALFTLVELVSRLKAFDNMKDIVYEYTNKIKEIT